MTTTATSRSPPATPPSVAATPLLTGFTDWVALSRTPAEVLDRLHEFAARFLPICVLGTARIPLQTSDWHSTRLGRDAFLHSSAAMAKCEFDPGVMMARSSLMAWTWTETMQKLDPIGIDRWPYELLIKYGMRDALTRAVGGRWLVLYWSRQTLGKVLTQPYRIILLLPPALPRCTSNS